MCPSTVPGNERDPGPGPMESTVPRDFNSQNLQANTLKNFNLQDAGHASPVAFDAISASPVSCDTTAENHASPIIFDAVAE
eukprot:11548216-Karenia_brevis.AAC.1